jgi:t-SNARE complex subunit (syntaxin)
LELATNFKFNLRQKIFQENKKIIKTNNRTNTKDLGNKFEETIKQFIFFRKVKRFLDDKKLFYICGVEGEIETCFLCYGHIIL